MDHLLSWIIVDFQLPIADLDHASIANSIGNRQSEIGNVKGYFDCQKTERSGLCASQGSCPLLTILAKFFVEIWERESAPAKLLPDIPAIDDGRLESE
jgi:hypothetical protein